MRCTRRTACDLWQRLVPSAEPTSLDLFHLDIDFRIGLDAWVQLWALEEWSDDNGRR